MEAWNQAWLTQAGREDWLTPDSFVVAHIDDLRRANVRRVLDLGFGVGRHALLLAKAGFTVYGIDASANGLAYTRDWAAQEGVELDLTTGDMASLPYDDDFFDAILTWNVIYHGLVSDIHQTIIEIRRCLKPHGYLVCSLISTQNAKCGRGNEIERHTFVVPGGGEKEYPHHYFDRDEVEQYLQAFDIRDCEDTAQASPDDYHWHVFAQAK